MIHNIAIVTNKPAPYRVALFDYIKKNYKDYCITVVYHTRKDVNRSWHIDDSLICTDVFLNTYDITLKGRFDKWVIRFPKGVWKAFKIIKPEIVVISEYGPVSLAVMTWCRLHRVKYISWTDGTYAFEKGISKVQKLARHLIIRHASAFIASSTESKKNQMMYGAPEEKIYLSFLTVDTQKLYYIREKYDNKKLLYVGRLVEIKGIDLLLQAMAKTTRTEVSLTIVGDGIEEDKLRKSVQVLGLDSRVRFIGFVEGEELHRYYQECDIFILPSRLEPFGLVVLEAMCNCMPVICSQYAGCIPDLINEKTGVVVNPYNTDRMAEIIDMLALDNNMVTQMGHASYNKAKQFSIQKSGDDFVKAINSILQ